MSLARKTLQGGFWNLVSNSGQQVVNFLFFIYLARLLDPAAFGLMALALVAVDVFGLLGRFGLVEASIQREEMPDDLQNRVFWLLAGIGALLAFFVLLVAAPMGALFGHADLVPVLSWLAPVCWLQNMAAVPEARLQKTFGFKILAKRNLWSVLLGGIVGVGMAYLGCGVYSLVGQKMTSVLVQNVILWGSEAWRPSTPIFNLSADVKQLIQIGWHVTVSELILTLNTKLMDVLVGVFLGAATLGYLRMAWKCFEVALYCSVISFANVALVTFTQLRNDSQRLELAYRRLTEISSMVLFPILMGLSAIAPVIVPVLFGAKWEPSIVLLQILGVMAVTSSIGSFFSPLVTATGHTRTLVVQGALQTISSLLLTACMAPLGVVAVVWGQVLRSLIISIYNLWILREKVHMPFSVTLKATLPALISSCVMWAAVTLCMPYVRAQGASDWSLIALMIIIGGIAYISTLAIGFQNDMKDLLKEAIGLIKGQRSGNDAPAL